MRNICHSLAVSDRQSSSTSGLALTRPVAGPRLSNNSVSVRGRRAGQPQSRAAPDARETGAAAMTVLLDHLAAGRIRPLIHDRLALAEAGRAQALLESGQVIGKLLLKP
jgi:NADPH:quinone reductase-like Zn-dependent oxidoreductase